MDARTYRRALQDELRSVRANASTRGQTHRIDGILAELRKLSPVVGTADTVAIDGEIEPVTHTEVDVTRPAKAKAPAKAKPRTKAKRG